MKFILDNVQISYRYPVLEKLRFTIEGPSLVAIMGANGSGKSSLLKCFAGQKKTSKGDLYLDEEIVQKLGNRELSKKVSYLPQQNSIDDSNLTVRELVNLGRFSHHKSFFEGMNKQDEKAIESALKKTGLLSLVENRVGTLSGGQRQKTWLAMSLAQETPVMLLDEPTSFLDEDFRSEFLSILRDLAHNENKLVVAVMHDLTEVFHYFDEVLVLEPGGLRAKGHPKAILESVLVKEVFGVDFDHKKGRLRLDLPKEKKSDDQDPLCILENVKFGYSTKRERTKNIFESLNVEVKGGRFNVVSGPNGSGKSTLLRILAQFQKPLGGVVKSRVTPSRIAYFFQEGKVPEGFTVEDYVYLGRYQKNRWTSQYTLTDCSIIDRCFADLGIENLKLRSSHQLSGGQIQKLRLAMALAREDKVLFLDEPLNFLDLGSQVELLTGLFELTRSKGFTVVAILHERWQIDTFADHVIELAPGYHKGGK